MKPPPNLAEEFIQQLRELAVPTLNEQGQLSRYLKINGVKGPLKGGDFDECFLLHAQGDNGVIQMENQFTREAKKNNANASQLKSVGAPVYQPITYVLDSTHIAPQIMQKCAEGAKIDEIKEKAYLRNESAFRCVTEINYQNCILTAVTLNLPRTVTVTFVFENIALKMTDPNPAAQQGKQNSGPGYCKFESKR